MGSLKHSRALGYLKPSWTLDILAPLRALISPKHSMANAPLKALAGLVPSRTFKVLELSRPRKGLGLSKALTGHGPSGGLEGRELSRTLESLGLSKALESAINLMFVRMK